MFLFGDIPIPEGMFGGQWGMGNGQGLRVIMYSRVLFCIIFLLSFSVPGGR